MEVNKAPLAIYHLFIIQFNALMLFDHHLEITSRIIELKLTRAVNSARLLIRMAFLEYPGAVLTNDVGRFVFLDGEHLPIVSALVVIRMLVFSV